VATCARHRLEPLLEFLLQLLLQLLHFGLRVLREALHVEVQFLDVLLQLGRDRRAHHRAFFFKAGLHGLQLLVLLVQLGGFFCCIAWMRVVATRPSADSLAMRCRTT
jgi:hypothetical protein